MVVVEPVDVAPVAYAVCGVVSLIRVHLEMGFDDVVCRITDEEVVAVVYHVEVDVFWLVVVAMRPRDVAPVPEGIIDDMHGMRAGVGDFVVDVPCLIGDRGALHT